MTSSTSQPIENGGANSSDANTTAENQASENAAMSIGSILKNLDGMSDIESLISSRLVSDAKLLRDIPTYLLELGGKRIRPALCLLVAKLCGMQAPNEALINVSAGIELIHMATLLHDDIIDRSPLRRGKPSPHLQFGETATLLAGDFLLVRAFALCAKLDAFIISETEEACVRLTEGEVLEQPLSKISTDVDGSLDIAAKKTAALFGLAAVSGAHLSAMDMPELELIQSKMKTFGLEVGVAFQILDDILDVTADENLLGKKCGGDLVEKKPSIVNVLWLESDSSLAKEILLRPEEELHEKDVQKALDHLRQDPEQVVSYAQELAVERITNATILLSEVAALIPDHDKTAYTHIESLLKFTLMRLQ